MKTQPLVIEKTYNAPVSKVWQALTDHNKMKQWYFDIKDFKPEIGFEFQFLGGDYLHICKVTAVIPNKKLSYTWKYDKHQGNSEVTFELFEEGGKTRLNLTHTGLESFPDEKDFRKESFTAGWTEIIGNNLKKFVE